MFLSIIICTRNRADEVVDCLPEVARQAREFSDVEVIVVDNGSTDNTREVVENAAKEYGYAFRYIFEPVAGLCQARNRGRAEAKGSVLTYIDDDERLEPNWISRIREHFLENKSDCLAGKVSVRLGGEPPFPFDAAMRRFFCTTEFGEEPRFLTFPEHPFGGNMSIKTEVFDSIDGFDTNLKLYGDETNFFSRASAKGFTMFYRPDVEVSQVIPANRLTKEELQHKSYIWGKGAATNWLLASPPGAGKRLTRIAEFGLRSLYMSVRLRTSPSFGKFYTLWYNRGYLAKLVEGLDESKN